MTPATYELTFTVQTDITVPAAEILRELRLCMKRCLASPDADLALMLTYVPSATL